jgi:hypothetical protein
VDSRYKNEVSDVFLVNTAIAENRIILTRDRGLLMRANVHYGYFVREIDPKKQIKEVVNHFNLRTHSSPFSRCANCNGLLQPVTKDEVYDRLEPRTRLYYDEFRFCSQCYQIYWQGSHFQRLKKFIEGLLDENF